MWNCRSFLTGRHGFVMLDSLASASRAEGKRPHPGWGVAILRLIRNAQTAGCVSRRLNTEP
jgi:hypothetical protein